MKPDPTSDSLPPAPLQLPALALDVGEVRVGCAVSDSAGRFVFGRGYFKRATGSEALEQDVGEVKALLEREGANVVVVGLPIRTDGADSVQTQRVRDFARALTDAGLQIEFQDERFSTRFATGRLRETGPAKGRDKGKTDEASAIAILELWLERTKARGLL